MQWCAGRMWPYEHGMLRPMSVDRGDIVTDCMIEILAQGGFPAVTLRALAERIGVTPSGVLRWFGTTDRMWASVAARFGWRWIAYLEDPARLHRRSPLRPTSCRDNVHRLLPGTDEEVIWTRVWLALVEVGRHCEDVGLVIDQIETEERELIDQLLGRGGDPLSVEAITATVRGLRHAICAPETPMSVRTAHAVLARQRRD
jgi:AcrR family transcriptional regulator